MIKSIEVEGVGLSNQDLTGAQFQALNKLVPEMISGAEWADESFIASNSSGETFSCGIRWTETVFRDNHLRRVPGIEATFRHETSGCPETWRIHFFYCLDHIRWTRLTLAALKKVGITHLRKVELTNSRLGRMVSYQIWEDNKGYSIDKLLAIISVVPSLTELVSCHLRAFLSNLKEDDHAEWDYTAELAFELASSVCAAEAETIRVKKIGWKKVR